MGVKIDSNGDLIPDQHKGATGLKHDQDKLPLELLDPLALEGLAAVLKFGAKKYITYGECDCQGPVKSIKDATALKTASGSTNGVEIIQQTIPSTELIELGLLLNGLTVSQIVNMSSFFKSQNVAFVVKNANSILITATKLEKYVGVFVVDAILHSAKWNGKNGWKLHEPTCGSLKELKVGAHNWRGGVAWGRVLGALLRHTFAILRGERTDPESGLPHIDHVGCCWMFASNFMKTRPDLDDLYQGDDKNG